MEKIHKLKLEDFCCAKICFREKDKLVSWGCVILTKRYEFAGHLNGDTIIGYWKDRVYNVLYHCETFEIVTIPFLGLRTASPYSRECKFELPAVDENFLGKEYASADSKYFVEFEEVLEDEKKVMEVLKESKDLFIR